MKQEVRIIGGRFRGKKLSFPSADGLRPTPDRVRETLFNWLMNDIRNARCLDAFAGSGALGLEAFSRGASEICFIEHNPTVVNALKKTLTQFESPQLTLLNLDAREYIRKTNQIFDIIFLDPPYHSPLLNSCIQEISQSTLLAPHGLVYIESSHEVDVDPLQWTILKHKKAGQVFYGILKKTSENIP